MINRLFGEVLAALGMLVSATAKSPEQLTAGLAIAGFGGGFCQMVGKTLPNLRHSLTLLPFCL